LRADNTFAAFLTTDFTDDSDDTDEENIPIAAPFEHVRRIPKGHP